MNPATPRVLVAAAPTLQRHGLLATLQQLRPDLFLSTTADVHGLPARLRSEAPALLILDAGLPGPSLSHLLSQVREAQPEQRLLVLSGRLPLSLRRHLVAQGARALLNRNATPEEVVLAVERLLPATPKRPHGIFSLRSPREVEVLGLVMQDHDNAEIAERLCLSVRTVESHRRALLQKTGARSLIGLVVMALEKGWMVSLKN